MEALRGPGAPCSTPGGFHVFFTASDTSSPSGLRAHFRCFGGWGLLPAADYSGGHPLR